MDGEDDTIMLLMRRRTDDNGDDDDDKGVRICYDEEETNHGDAAERKR